MKKRVYCQNLPSVFFAAGCPDKVEIVVFQWGCNGLAAKIVAGRALSLNSDTRQLVCTLNRALPLEPDPEGWVHAIPFGEFPGVIRYPDGRKEPGTLVADRESLNAVVAEFERQARADDFEGLLLDRDHQSHIPGGSTEAMGYIKGMAIRGDGSTPADGLYLRIAYTAPGAEAIRGKVYRRISVAADHAPAGNGRWRFASVTDAALTNRNNLPVQAISLNRAPVWEQVKKEEPPASATEQEPGKGEEKNMDYKAMLIQLLGLPADASDEAIQAKQAEMSQASQNRESDEAKAKSELEDMKKELATSQNRVAELEAGALRVEAEAFCEKQISRGLKIDRVATLNSYIASKDHTIALFQGITVPEARAPKSLNDGKDPAGNVAGQEKKDQPTGVARTAKAFAASSKK